MMNDEIDAFHKNRDVVPLNISEGMEESDEDNEQPVFDFEYLRAKFGGVEDEMLDDADEEEQERVVWGKKKDMYGADVDYEDFGLEDASQDETDREPTFEEILDHGKPTAKAFLDKGIKDEDGMTYEIVKKDLNALTKEEQMDVVYSSAPELIGLLSELNDALEQLENKVNPLLTRGRESAKKGGMHYLEVKQLLLQSFCQAITFYLLLKSEGQPVRDHPVVSRLVEIKSLLDKVKEMDEKLPFDVEDIVNKDVNNMTIMKLVEENAALESDSFTNSQVFPTISSEKQAIVEPVKAADLNTLTLKNTKAHHKHQDKQMGSQSMEMLKVRASLEEKLKQKGVFGSVAPTSVGIREHVQPVNRQLETLDDFVDDAMEKDAHSDKISRQLIRSNKRKVISGDDDIPKRDDIGERRRKHELRVLAGAGIEPIDDFEDETADLSSDGIADVNGESDADSDLEYYKQVEQEHAAKLAAKSDKYSRTREVSSLTDTTVDGKRHISNQMEKNRGLTRARKKLIKNPRKKYKQKVEIFIAIFCVLEVGLGLDIKVKIFLTDSDADFVLRGEEIIDQKMMQHKRATISLEQSSFMELMPKRLKTADVPLSSKQEKKDKVSERISALQQIVSPFGKTDTASVLLEAMEYIQFLHEQVKEFICRRLKIRPKAFT
ncbi:hypothetical protein DH2020_049493 [Rehmannia glutinosa]|uniref:BHLH domain-containing protein n=1 Tax=Rehmannia glutinosa TaxID=99300 RepID=A0ABR0U3H3_REHGL